MNNRTLLFLLLWTVNISGFSQEPKKWVHSYTYRYLSVHDGLAQAQVFKSFQDSYGYLWFATNNGVSRFDGLRFDNFSQEDLHINSRIKYFGQYESAVYMVSGNNIVFVYPDQTLEYYPFPDSYYMNEEYMAAVGDNLYLFNCLSAAQRDLINYTLFQFNLKTKAFTRLAENLPTLECYTFGQKVYACTCYEIKNKQLTLYQIKDGQLQTVQIVQMGNYSNINFKITKRNEWFANIDSYLYQCFIENDSLRWNRLMLNPPNELKCIEHWDGLRFLGGFVIPQNDPIFILDVSSRSLSPFPLNTLMVNDILADRDGNVWFSSEEGIYQCSRTFFEYYQLNLGHNDNIWGVIKDSLGNVWFSSNTYGLWRVDAQGYLHRPKFVYDRKGYVGIEHGYMSNYADKQGRIFQLSDRGIAIFDPKYGDPDRVNNYSTGVSLFVYHDPENGNIWFGGNTEFYRTLNVLHPNGKLSTYPFGTKHIISISRDGNRKLRIGTWRGEAWFDEENQSVVFDTIQRPYAGVSSMALDEEGILWKGTTNGFFAEDRYGNDRKIADGKIYFVINYKNQYIIYGAKNDLYVLDLPAYHRDSTVSIRTFGIYEGFDLLECGQNGASIDPEGYVWVAGVNKAIRFLPEQIMKIPLLQARVPYLAAIYSANKKTEWSLVQTSPSIKLPNKENYLRFDILQASVSAPDQLIFRYKLKGYNNQWITSRDHSLIFQNLPFGKFRLELQSSFDNGKQWSESVFSPVITILKPFFLTFPGLLLIFSGIAIVAALLIYYTHKISIRKQEEARQIDQLKHKAVQAKFIPHFTRNVLNTISFYISKNPDSARKYISEFSDFSYMTLRNSDQLQLTIQEELDYSLLYLELEKLRFEEKLEYSVSVEPEVNTQKMMPTMVLQTFCENAIKHGLLPKEGGGKITIRVYQEKDYVVLTAEDNGIGREQARVNKTEGTKEGLNIVQQQLDIFNKNQSKKAFLQIVDLYDECRKPAGTRFELYIP